MLSLIAAALLAAGAQARPVPFACVEVDDHSAVKIEVSGNSLRVTLPDGTNGIGQLDPRYRPRGNAGYKKFSGKLPGGIWYVLASTNVLAGKHGPIKTYTSDGF